MAPSIKIKYERSDIQPGLQAYGLKVTVTQATDMPESIFVMRRDVVNANTPMNQEPVVPTGNPGIQPDTFICLADPVDLEEFPENIPDPANEMPYYRVKAVEFWFRSPDLLEDTYNLLAADIAKLVKSLQSLASIATTEEITYA